MLRFLLSGLGKYKEPVAILLIGIFVGPYFLKQAISAFTPLMAESRNIRDDLKQEIRSAEARGQQYSDMKTDMIMQVLNKIDARQTRQGAILRELSNQSKVTGLMLNSSDTNEN